jgi:hypothetical protein
MPLLSGSGDVAQGGTACRFVLFLIAAAKLASLRFWAG